MSLRVFLASARDLPSSFPAAAFPVLPSPSSLGVQSAATSGTCPPHSSHPCPWLSGHLSSFPKANVFSRLDVCLALRCMGSQLEQNRPHVRIQSNLGLSHWQVGGGWQEDCWGLLGKRGESARHTQSSARALTQWWKEGQCEEQPSVVVVTQTCPCPHGLRVRGLYTCEKGEPCSLQDRWQGTEEMDVGQLACDSGHPQESVPAAASAVVATLTASPAPSAAGAPPTLGGITSPSIEAAGLQLAWLPFCQPAEAARTPSLAKYP